MLNKIIYSPLAQQFLRFVGVGFLNTAVDYAVFNFFASFFDAYFGLAAGLMGAMSFVVAVFHSFFWNKHWGFTTHDQTKFLEVAWQFIAAAILGAVVIALAIVGSGKQFGALYFLGLTVLLIILELAMWQIFKLKKDEPTETSNRKFAIFVFVSLVSVFINSGIIALLTTLIPPQFGFSQNLWTNFAKVFATGVALIWNFAGYKIFVFKTVSDISKV